MQGDASVVQQLNKVLTTELTSINQFFLHARMSRNWGLSTLNEKAYKKSIMDMKQADDLIERILFLGGLPNLQHLEKLRIGEDVPEIINCDHSFLSCQLIQLKDAIALCEKQQDYVSRELLEKILHGEEEYLDWLETQQHLLSEMGLENYLQSLL